MKSQEFDPEAETVKRSLVDLGFPVSETKVAKVYELVLESKTKGQAEKTAISICKRLLANPTKDDYSVTIEQIGPN